MANRTSPMTRETMPPGSLVVNRALCDAIEEWRSEAAAAHESARPGAGARTVPPSASSTSQVGERMGPHGLVESAWHPSPSAPPPPIASRVVPQSRHVDATATAELLRREGRTLRDSGDHARAEAAFREAVRIAPNFAPAWVDLAATLLIRTGDIAAGEAAISEAIKADRTYAPAWLAMGLLAGGKGDVANAVKAFRNAVTYDPNYAQAWCELGSVLMRQQKDFEGAEQAFKKAIEIDPKCVKAWGDLGAILAYIKGDESGAERAFRRAVEADPRSSSAWCDLGMLLGMRKDYQGAITAFRKALELDPTNEHARGGLEGVSRMDLSQRIAAARLRHAGQARNSECVLS